MGQQRPCCQKVLPCLPCPRPSSLQFAVAADTAFCPSEGRASAGSSVLSCYCGMGCVLRELSSTSLSFPSGLLRIIRPPLWIPFPCKSKLLPAQRSLCWCLLLSGGRPAVRQHICSPEEPCIRIVLGIEKATGSYALSLESLSRSGFLDVVSEVIFKTGYPLVPRSWILSVHSLLEFQVVGA